MTHCLGPVCRTGLFFIAAALVASLTQLLDNNPILTFRRNCKLFRSLRDCFLLVGSLNHPEMFGADA
jgi:hypothetical protein